MNKITLNTIVKQAKDYLSSSLGDEIVMMSIKEGSYFSLNPVGTLIWNSIEEEITVHNLCQELMKVADVETEECQADVLDFLRDLEQKNMITIKNG